MHAPTVIGTLMDRMHKSIIVFDPKKPTQIIAGLTFKVEKFGNFCKIEFLAVHSPHQKKGLGTKLINLLKDYMVRKFPYVSTLIVQADNSALDFYSRLGFYTKKQKERPILGHFLTKYDGATLMECKVQSKYNYSRI